MALLIEHGRIVSDDPRYRIRLYARSEIERAIKTIEWFLFGKRWWVHND